MCFKAFFAQEAGQKYYFSTFIANSRAESMTFLKFSCLVESTFRHME